MKKILITGSNGLLGQKLVYALLKRADVQIVATSVGVNRLIKKEGYIYESLDITKKSEVEAELFSDKLIIKETVKDPTKVKQTLKSEQSSTKKRRSFCRPGMAKPSAPTIWSLPAATNRRTILAKKSRGCTRPMPSSASRWTAKSGTATH